MKRLLSILLIILCGHGIIAQTTVYRAKRLYADERFYLPRLASDPATFLQNGSMYYNTSVDSVKIRISGVWVTLGMGTGGGGGGSGDFSSNTSSSVDGEILLFSGTGGKTGKRATGTGFVKSTSGVYSVQVGILDADLSANVPLKNAANIFSVDQSVPDEVYDATSWNGSLEVPTKNALRDKIESMSGGGAPSLTEFNVGVGNSSDVLSGSTNMTWNGSEFKMNGAAASTWYQASGVTQPFTFAGSIPSTLTSRVGVLHGTTGGSFWQGFSSGDNISVLLQGHVGSASPTIAPVHIQGYKTDGGTGRTDLGSSEKIVSFFNAATEVVTINGAGHVSVADEIYDATAWNGSVQVPTKNAVRDKIESLAFGTVNNGTQYRIGYYATTGTAISPANAITANRALISDLNGVPTHSPVTATELGYSSGVTSSIQTQLNGKVGTEADPLSIHLGGSSTLTSDVTIVGGATNNIHLTGSTGELFKATQSGAGNYAMEADALEYGINSIAGELPLNLQNDNTNTNAIRPIMSLYRNGANGTTGIGLSQRWYIRSSTGSVPQASEWGFRYTNATNGSETAELFIQLKNSGGGSLAERFKLNGNGALTLGGYTSVGSITGGAAIGNLQYDASGNIIAGALAGVGSGDFSSNTSSSVDGEFVLFSGTAGKTGRRATGTGYAKSTSGVFSVQTGIPDADLTANVPLKNTANTFTLDQTVPDEVYDATNWNGSLEVPTKNSLRDYLVTLGGGGDFSSNTATSVDNEIVLFSGTGGKTGKRATGTGFAKLAAGVLSAQTGILDADLSANVPLKNAANTFSADQSVPDEAYASGWNGSLEVPTKNALWDKIETITGGGGLTSGQVAAQINDSLEANAAIFDNSNLGDTIMRFISPNIFQYKGLVPGDNVKHVVTDSTIRISSSPLVYSQYANATVSNTTTETSALSGTLAGVNAVDGATLTIGSIIKLKGSGTIATGSGGRDLSVIFKFSNQQATASVTGLGASSTFPYTYEATFIPRALGTNTAVVISYTINIGTLQFIGSATSTMTTTGTVAGDFRIDWGTADAANIATSHTNFLEVIRIQ